MAGIEPFLILAVAALDLAVVARRIWTDQLMPDAQLRSRLFKQRRQIALTVGEPIGKLKAVVRLDTFHLYVSAGVPRPQLPQEICRGVCRLFRVSGEKAQAGELVDSSVLKQAKLRICNAFAWHDLHIDLNALSGMGHLLVRLWFVRIFWIFWRKQPHFAHDAEQALRAAGVAALPQAVPELDHAERRIPAAHVADELQLGLRVLVWMAVRPPGLAGKGRHASVPALLPEVDIRPALVVFPAGTAHSVLFCVLHQGLTIVHVLCYNLTHEGYGLLSGWFGVTTQL